MYQESGDKRTILKGTKKRASYYEEGSRCLIILTFYEAPASSNSTSTSPKR